MHFITPLLKYYKFATSIFIILFITGVQTGNAQIDDNGIKQQSLSGVLNSDGSLRAGVTGTFDAKGFSVVRGSNGNPVFRENKLNGAADNANWDNTASVGVGIEVNAIAVIGNDVYAGGNNIFKWNGTTWTIPGGGVNGTVNALAVSGSTLYAGGSFTMAGGIAANNIASWNGTSWSALGLGVDSTVRCMAFGFELYVGGSFKKAGGLAANRIAQWNGATWSPMGAGMNRDVYCLYNYAGEVYAGGAFNTAGGISANRIAKWSAAVWSALGTGADSMVYTIAVTNNIVYAGGVFNTAGGNAARHIAQWSGTTWSAVGAGLNRGETSVSSIVSDLSGGIYVGYVKDNSRVDGGTFSGVARWRTSWSDVGSTSNNIKGVVKTLRATGNDLITGGSFYACDSRFALNIARWNGASWSAFGSAVNANVTSIATNGTDIYAVGSFSSAGGDTAYNVAKWNGTSWSALGNSRLTGAPFVGGIIYTIAVLNNNVYVGGAFESIGNVAAVSVAKWNGTAWSALGSGVQGTVYSVVVNGGDIYVGGLFNSAGSVPTNSIAKWDGIGWSALGVGTQAGGNVVAIAVDGSNVYAGGYFDTIGGTYTRRLAKWNGASWSAVGVGFGSSSASVTSLVSSGGKLYVGGYFDSIGGIAAKHIAVWDGTTWSPLGTGMNSLVSSMAVDGTNLYARGYFTMAGGVSANSIAKWNGLAWEALGNGLTAGSDSYNMSAVAVKGGDVYVGGGFTIAGDKPAPHFAIYRSQGSLPVTCKSFNYQLLKTDIKLVWSTAVENNNDHFNIQRSFTGTEFTTIAIANAHGAGDYSFIDKNPLVNSVSNIYYRLQQVDKDGKTSFICQSLKIPAAIHPAQLSIWPNPATLGVNISCSKMRQLIITDAIGRVVMNENIDNASNIQLDLNRFLKGVYIVKVITDDYNTQSQKLMIE
jgi:hypothetical protein